MTFLHVVIYENSMGIEVMVSLGRC